MQFLTIDRMAQRYGKLPSEIMQNATVSDFRTMDVADSYQNYVRVKQENKGHTPAPEMTEEQMKERLAATRKFAKEQKEKRNKK